MIAPGLCRLFLSLILFHMLFPCLLWSTHGWMQGKFFCILCDLHLLLHSPNTTCHSPQVLVGTAVLNWAGREKSTHATDKRHVNCYHYVIMSWDFSLGQTVVNFPTTEQTTGERWEHFLTSFQGSYHSIKKKKNISINHAASRNTYTSSARCQHESNTCCCCLFDLLLRHHRI